MNRDTTTIIVTYKNKNDLSPLIKKLIKDSKVIIVNNSKKDKYIENLINIYPISLIQNKKNLGFAKAVNMGIKKSNGDILLINPDTNISEHTVKKLKIIATSTSNIAAVTPKILNTNGSLQPNCGKFPTAFNLVIDKLPILKKYTPLCYLFRTDTYYESENTPSWISGTCMFINRNALNKVGLFDEDYFMYGEDLDWCYRAKQKGYKVLYSPKLTISHHDDGRKPERYPDKFYNMRKAFLLFFTKHNKLYDLKIFKYVLKIELTVRSIFEVNDKIWKRAYNKTGQLIYEDFNSITRTT